MVPRYALKETSFHSHFLINEFIRYFPFRKYKLDFFYSPFDFRINFGAILKPFGLKIGV